MCDWENEREKEKKKRLLIKSHVAVKYWKKKQKTKRNQQKQYTPYFAINISKNSNQHENPAPVSDPLLYMHTSMYYGKSQI